MKQKQNYVNRIITFIQYYINTFMFLDSLVLIFQSSFIHSNKNTKYLKVSGDNFSMFGYFCAIYCVSPCNRKHVGACVHHDEEEDPS